MRELKNKHVLVTGSEGFFGSYIIRVLENRGAYTHGCPHYKYNLLREEHVFAVLRDTKPDYIIHVAAFTGGITWNKKYPADILWKNTTMGFNLLKQTMRFPYIKKIVNIITSCSYPDKNILHESEYWDGLPNETIMFFGLAKRNLQAYSMALYKQHQFPAVCACVNNLYGPYDTFNLNRTKVVGALIRKFIEAKQQGLPEVVCLGTGTPRRDFIYVEDAAEAVVRVLERYENPMLPINIGRTVDFSIETLAKTIKEIVGYKGNIVWDTSFPDGQMKKKLVVNTMKKVLDYEPPTLLYDGLEKTIAWYMANKKDADRKE